MNDNYNVYGKYGCWWEGGTGVSPDGHQCGECYPNYEGECPFLEKYRHGEHCPGHGDKQIEEMAKLMVDSDNKEVADTLSLFFVRLAEALYNAGYRKQNEVVWAIFDDIDKIAYRYLNDAYYSGGDMIYDLNEIKEKYTKGDAE